MFIRDPLADTVLKTFSHKEPVALFLLCEASFENKFSTLPRTTKKAEHSFCFV